MLYREGWGQRGFTSAEATALAPSEPALGRAGHLWIATAAAVIESRVQEAGGTPKAETASARWLVYPKKGILPEFRTLRLFFFPALMLPGS